jgi:glycosyltransferase involved in cell wall biosynthesis
VHAWENGRCGKYCRHSSDTPMPVAMPVIALAFVGAVVPDEPRYHTPSFSRSGNNFQVQLIQGLARRGTFDIEVFSARQIPSYPRSATVWMPADREYLDGTILVRLLPFPNLTLLKQFVIGVGVLFSLIFWGWRKRKLGDRVVLTYNVTMPPGVFTLLGARLARAKAVVSVNDINIPGETVPSSTLWRLDIHLQRWLLPKFDGHFAVSDDIARDFFPGRPFVRMEGGVDSVFLDRTRRTSDSSRRTDGAFIFASAGWLNEANGIPIVLAAFAMVPRGDFRLRVAGMGPLRPMVEEAARRDSRIEYLGMLDAEGVAGLYRTADVLLNIRLTKGMDTRYLFPSKLIEYLASGVPTITTSVGHVEDEFSRLVYVLRDETAEGLASILSSVAARSSDERTRLASEARTYVATNKSWDAQAAKVDEYLRKVVLSKSATEPPSGASGQATRES